MAKTTGSWSDVICTVPTRTRSIDGGVAYTPLPADTAVEYPLSSDATYVILRCILGSYVAYKFKSTTDTADCEYYDGGPFLDFCPLGSTNIERIPVGATSISFITGVASHLIMSLR